MIGPIRATVMRYQTDAPLGLRVLKAFCFLFCVFSLLDLIPGIYPAGLVRSDVLGVSHRVSWLVALVNTFLFGTAYYGLRRRTAIAWSLGWVFLGAFFSEAVTLCLASTLHLQESDRWIASAAVVAGCAAVAIYWGLWWKRQKRYFRP